MGLDEMRYDNKPGQWPTTVDNEVGIVSGFITGVVKVVQVTGPELGLVIGFMSMSVGGLSRSRPVRVG